MTDDFGCYLRLEVFPQHRYGTQLGGDAFARPVHWQLRAPVMMGPLQSGRTTFQIPASTDERRRMLVLCVSDSGFSIRAPLFTDGETFAWAGGIPTDILDVGDFPYLPAPANAVTIKVRNLWVTTTRMGPQTLPLTGALAGFFLFVEGEEVDQYQRWR